MSLKLTKITSNAGQSTKSIPANAETKADIQAAPQLITGKFEIIEFNTISDLKGVFESTEINQSYCYGSTDQASRYIGSKKAVEENSLSVPQEAVTRTLDWFHFNDGPGVLYIDYDVKGDSKPEIPLLVLSKLFRIIPELESAPVLVKPSAGSYIWDKEKDDWFVKDSGLHIYFLIDNQKMVPSIVNMLHAKFAQIDAAPKSAVSLDYHSIECNGKFEKRDFDWIILNRDKQPVTISTDIQVDENTPTASVGKMSDASKKTVSELVDIIRTGNDGLHEAIRDYSYGLIKDGVHESAVIQTIQGIMQAIPAESLRYFDDVPRIVKGAVDLLKEKGTGDTFNTIEAVRVAGKEDAAFPRMPAFKKPEVIELVEKQFALQSFNPIPEMQAPHVDAFLAVTLNGKFLTPAYGRLPNVMGFGLAESAAGKGVNSDQVAKNLLQKYGAISNALFDANPIDTYGPATITAQTSLVEELGSVERENGMIWLVPEADNNLRSFETNASMKAIGATIKELFDGHDVKAVKKANSGRNTGKVPGVRMANCSLAWYSQPDVFFGVANPENLADGLFGRFSVYLYSPTEEDERLEDELLMSGWKQPDFDEDFLKFLRYTIGQCADNSIRLQVAFESGRHLTDFKKRCKREDNNLNLYLKRIFMIGEKMLTAWCGWDYLWTNYRKGQQPLDKDAQLIIKEEWEIEIVKWCEYQLDLKENYVFDRIGENVSELRNTAIIDVIVELQNNPEKAAGMAGIKNEASKQIVEKTVKEKGWVPRASVAEALRKRSILRLSNNEDRKKLINSCVEADDIPIFEDRVGKMRFLYIGELA